MTGHEVVLRPAVDVLVRESGAHVIRDADGTVRIGSGEVVHVVRAEEGLLTVTTTVRGAVRVETVRTRDLAVVERYLAVLQGPDWRQRAGLNRISTTKGPFVVPPAYRWTVEGQTRVKVTWPEGMDVGVASGFTDVRATTLVRALAHSVEDVVASYRDPAGRPVFPQ